MENISEEIAVKENYLHLSIDVKIPGTLVNVNQGFIQEAVRILIQNNPQALTGNSPEDVLINLGFSSENMSNANPYKPQKKWGKMLQRLKKHSMSPESLKKFNEGREEFRENFVMTDPLLNEET